MKTMNPTNKENVLAGANRAIDKMLQFQTLQSCNCLVEFLSPRVNDLRQFFERGGNISTCRRFLNDENVECSRYELRDALVQLKLWPVAHRKTSGKKRCRQNGDQLPPTTPS